MPGPHAAAPCRSDGDRRLRAGTPNRVDATATALDIHTNTVRHRLKRFEELTGRSLSSSEVAVELWLAMQARQLLGGNGA